jgi:alcohol dehydrogenase (cytochrome c)
LESCPHAQGGVNFWPTAYHPGLKLAYGASLEACSEIVIKGEATYGDGFRDYQGAGHPWIGAGASAKGEHRSSLSAMDVGLGQMIKKAIQPYPNYSGLVVTGGKLLFTAFLDGTLAAFDAETLERLWHINLGVQFQAPPMTFAVNGKQYLAVLGGGGGQEPAITLYGISELATMERAYMLWVFAL